MILREATIKYKGYDPDELSKGSGKRVCCSCDICGRVRWAPFFSYRDLCNGCSSKQYYIDHPEARKKQSDILKKYYIDHPEAIERISKQSTGRIQTNKSKEKKREKMIGFKHKQESIEKIRAAAINQWKNKDFYTQMCGENHPNYNPEINQFIVDNQGKYFCHCGCKRVIEIKRMHFWHGIPKFIHGHSKNFLGYHHAMESRIKMSILKSDINIEEFNGFKSFEIYPKEFFEIKTYIRNKYNNCDYLTGIHRNVCNIFVKKINELSVHHIDYNKQNSDENNLIPLSIINHIKTNYNRNFWYKLFKYSLEYDKNYYKKDKIFDVFEEFRRKRF